MAMIDHLHQAQADYEAALVLCEHADEELNLTPFNVPWVTPSYHLLLTIHQLRVILRALEEAQSGS